MTEPKMEGEDGALPKQHDHDPNQDAANARTIRALYKVGKTLPGKGTPLGDWLHVRIYKRGTIKLAGWITLPDEKLIG
jgi:hypothetical protein